MREMLWGERRIAAVLEKNKVKYRFNYLVDELYTLTLTNIRLDFVIVVDGRIAAIEYDQPHHFAPEPGLPQSIYRQKLRQYRRQKKYDALINNYCRKNKVPLLRIPHYKWKEIDSLVTNFIYELGRRIENGK